MTESLQGKLQPIHLMITFDLLRNEPEYARYAAGVPVFEEGDASTGMFVVLEGEVDITVDGRWIETVPPGGVFGGRADPIVVRAGLPPVPEGIRLGAAGTDFKSVPRDP